MSQNKLMKGLLRVRFCLLKPSKPTANLT